jgi:hypothetical protein
MKNLVYRQGISNYRRFGGEEKKWDIFKRSDKGIVERCGEEFGKLLLEGGKQRRSCHEDKWL